MMSYCSTARKPCPLIQILACSIVAVSFGLVSGCGSGGPALAPVTGTVTLKGKPVKSGTIILEAAGTRPATGKIKDGQIVEMTTFEPGDGAPIGNHNVAINVTADASSAVMENPGDSVAVDANYMGGASLIPARFNDPTTSGFKAEIKKGKNELEFDIVP